MSREEPARTRKHLTPLLSVVQPSFLKPKLRKIEDTCEPSALLMIRSGSLSSLVRSLGLRIKSAPAVGEKFCELSTPNTRLRRVTPLTLSTMSIRAVNDVDTSSISIIFSKEYCLPSWISPISNSA